MSDWENEDLDQEDNNNQQNKIVFNEFDDESEVIPEEQKKQKIETKKPKEETIDYEKKYQMRKKKDIAIMKEIEESIKNIEDPELKLKKKLELMNLKQVEKFMGEDDTEQVTEQKLEEIDLNFDLKTEKDYIKLAQKSSAKINQTIKSNLNVFEFIKASMELLLPTLSEEPIENVKNALIFLKNKKDKTGDKKKKAKEEEKPKVQKSDKFEERKALYRQYGDGDINENKPNDEDDYNDDGDFM